MSKEPTGLKYPMVDLFTDVTMSLMYLNLLTASNLLLLSAPWLFTQIWMKGLESGRVLHRKEGRLLATKPRLKAGRLPGGVAGL